MDSVAIVEGTGLSCLCERENARDVVVEITIRGGQWTCMYPPEVSEFEQRAFRTGLVRIDKVEGLSCTGKR